MLYYIRMHQILQSHHPMRHVKSFRYAFEGLFHALLNEANFRVQIIIAAATAFAGFYFKITTTEWAIIIITMGLLLSGEMVNTVIEEFIDHLIAEESEAAKIIKDLGAGFVLVTALSTLVILALIFGPKIYALF